MPAIFSKLKNLSIRWKRELVENSPSPTDLSQLVEEKPCNFLEHSKIVSESMEQTHLLSLNTDIDQIKTSHETMKILMHEMRRRFALTPYDQNLVTSLLTAIEQWLVLYHLYGFNFEKKEIDSYIKCCTKTFDCAIAVTQQSGNWMAYFKNKNAAFFSHWYGQPLPPLDGDHYGHPGVLFGGKLYSYTRKLARVGAIESFALSILQSKKGMPRPSDDMVEKAVAKNFETMTSPKPEYVWKSEWIDHSTGKKEQHIFDREFMQMKLRMRTREILRKHKFDLGKYTKPFMPSPSANFQFSRDNFGSYGSLTTLPFFEDAFEASEPVCRLRVVKLMKYVSEYYGQKGKFDEGISRIEQASKEVLGLEIDSRDFCQRFRNFFWKCVDFAQTESPYVSVVGLKESLKIRCISKGPPITYFVLKPLQRWLWKALQQFKLFELTGQPVTEDNINQVFGNVESGVYRMHSGDYSAATDELYSWVSETICSEINTVIEKQCVGWTKCLGNLFQRSLTGHTYVKSKKTAKMIAGGFYGPFPEEELKEQMRGQLMGSITSFPILCIANATLIATAYELAHGVEIPLTILPSRINGDDCLTRYESKIFPVLWKGLGSVMGFSESLGKTYDCTDFMSVNSAFFRLIGDKWRNIKYINLGLVNGIKRSESKEDEKGATCNPYELGVLCKDAHAGTPVGLRKRLVHLMLYKHGKTLSSYRGPWFLPSWLCGLGLPSDEEIERPTRSICLELMKMYASGTHQVPRVVGDKDWFLYDAFNHEVAVQSDNLVVPHSFEQYEDDNTQGVSLCHVSYARLAVEGIYGLYDPQQSQWKEVMKKSEKLWAKATKGCDNTRCAPIDVLAYEAKQSVRPVISLLR